MIHVTTLSSQIGQLKAHENGADGFRISYERWLSVENVDTNSNNKVLCQRDLNVYGGCEWIDVG